jgi:hypothetical protein
MESNDSGPVLTYTPDNEPYLGRQQLFHYDQMISCMLEQNAVTAPMSHDRVLSDQQHMACQVIPQAISIALSIRELIRQGYLFGGHVLLRALVERAAILLYLHEYPMHIEIWNRGWHSPDAPSLSKMFDAIQEKGKRDCTVKGRDLTAPLNSIMHSKPDCARWNLIQLGESRLGHAPSKILDNPDLCDELCANVIPWLVVVQGMMAAYFPKDA